MNEGDIELKTGNVPNARIIMTAPSVQTTGDVFVKGGTEGISAKLASLKNRLQTAEEEITTIKTEMASLLSTETDPQVGTVTQDKWCVGTSGGQVECTANQPLLSYTETDPQVGTVTQDKWCIGTSGGQVECTAKSPATPLSCNPPRGRLIFNGDQYVCVCDGGYSGAECEIMPSLSKAETTADSKISGALAIADDGHTSSNSYSRVP